MVDRDVTVSQAAVELGMATYRLRARLRAESVAATAGWTISQISAMVRVINEGPITVSALAQAEHVRPQSMTDTVVALKAKDLVVAKQDPTDGRKTLLSATAKGRRLVRSVGKSREAWLAQAIEAVLDPEEVQDLLRAVEILNRLAECELRPAADVGWRG
jgi:DNA-binding MarR family transcriptional regulator